jgi:hypothetical protein
MPPPDSMQRPSEPAVQLLSPLHIPAAPPKLQSPGGAGVAHAESSVR